MELSDVQAVEMFHISFLASLGGRDDAAAWEQMQTFVAERLEGRT